MSFGSNVHFQTHMPGGTLEIAWKDGTFMMAAIDESVVTPRWAWWGRRRTLSVSNLNEGVDFQSDLWSWAVAVPFEFLAVMFAIPPAWWFLVYRDRREYTRRVEEGLCLNCGYDPRHSTDGICPECGNNPRQLVSGAYHGMA